MPRDRRFDPAAVSVEVTGGMSFLYDGTASEVFRGAGGLDVFVVDDFLTIFGAAHGTNNVIARVASVTATQIVFAGAVRFVDEDDSPATLRRDVYIDPREWEQHNQLAFDASGSKNEVGVRQFDKDKQSGHGFAYLVDLLFDSLVKEDEFGRPQAVFQFDTLSGPNVGKGDPRIWLDATIDDGETWQRLPRELGRWAIPGINVGESLLNKKLRVRQVFAGQLYGPVGRGEPQLEEMRTHIAFEPDLQGNPVEINRTEDNAELAEGQFFGTWYNPATQCVEVLGRRQLSFPGTQNTGIIIPNVDDVLTLSTGELDPTLVPAGNPPNPWFRPLIPKRSANSQEIAETLLLSRQLRSFCIDFMITFADRPDTPPAYADIPDIAEGFLLGWLWRDDMPRPPTDFDDMGFWIQIFNRDGNDVAPLANGLAVHWTFPIRSFWLGEEEKDDIRLITRVMATPRETKAKDNDTKRTFFAGDQFRPGLPYRVTIMYDGLTGFILIDGRIAASQNFEAAFTFEQKIRHDELGITPYMRGDLFIGTHPRDTRPDYVQSGKFVLSDLRLFKSYQPSQSDLNRWKYRTLMPGEVTRLQENIVEDQKGLAAYYPLDGKDTTGANGGFVNSNNLAFDVGVQELHGHAHTVGGLPWPEIVTTGPWGGLRHEEEGNRVLILPYRISPPLDLTRYAQALYVTTAPFNLEYNGQVYRSVWHVGEVSSVEENSTGDTTKLKLTLNGVMTSHVSIAMAANYRDRPCILYGWFFDPITNKPIGEPIILFRGKVDQMTVAIGKISAVTVTVTSELAMWEQTHARRWDENDQRSRFPRDDGLEFIHEMVDREVWWPARLFEDV